MPQPNPSSEVDTYEVFFHRGWSTFGSFLTPRRNFAVDTGGSCYMWLAGGYGPDGTPLSSMEFFCFPAPTPTATATATPTATATVPSSPTPTPSEPPCEVSGSYPACNSTVSTEVTDFVVYVSYFIFKGVSPSAFTVNGIPADSAEVGGSLIIFHFSVSPLIRGENTMHIPAGAFDCINGRGVEEFMCTFTYQPSTPTPTRRPSPTPRVAPTPRPRPTPPHAP